MSVRISQLPGAAEAQGDHELPASRGGESVKLTAQQIAALALAQVRGAVSPELDTLEKLADFLANALAGKADASALPHKVGNMKVTPFDVSDVWTPDPNMLFAIIEAEGGAGAGGGVTGAASQYYCGAGGGAGAYARTIVTATDVGETEPVTIGPGGNGVGGGTGNDGGTTSVGAHCSAPGGQGGARSNSSTQPNGGNGGQAASAVGDVAMSGQPGSGGAYAVGMVAAGKGGDSPFGPGGEAGVVTSGGTILPGSAGERGGGGSGASANNTTASAAGGAGGTGFVLITEFLSE